MSVFRSESKSAQLSTATAKSTSVVARPVGMPCAYDSHRSRAIAPTRRHCAAGTAARKSRISAVSQARSARFAKSSEESLINHLRGLETTRIACI
jgi:hypothetical protein